VAESVLQAVEADQRLLDLAAETSEPDGIRQGWRM
jgi:hypothetical protein